eukprot:COSAG03_NODE_1741_length_3580_cov_2.345303_3_plen_124_part_00
MPPGAEGLITVPHFWGCRFPDSRPSLRGATLGWSHTHCKAHLYTLRWMISLFTAMCKPIDHRSNIDMIHTVGLRPLICHVDDILPLKYLAVNSDADNDYEETCAPEQLPFNHGRLVPRAAPRR